MESSEGVEAVRVCGGKRKQSLMNIINPYTHIYV